MKFQQRNGYDSPLPILGADRVGTAPNCPPHPIPVPLPHPLPPGIQTAIIRLQNQIKATLDHNLVVRKSIMCDR